jgi:hypothetical protein
MSFSVSRSAFLLATVLWLTSTARTVHIDDQTGEHAKGSSRRSERGRHPAPQAHRDALYPPSAISKHDADLPDPGHLVQVLRAALS